MKIRVGQGYDVHRFAEDRNLILGGIHIPYSKGLLGHSDADVLIHAICDALLGAANLRDIGYHFPDDSQDFKNIDSKILLSKTVELVRSKGFEIGNIDSIICAQKPKLKEYIEQMQFKLAEVMHIAPEDICVKATTTEKLGFVGREEGIAAFSTVLLIKD
jgi:2-C-methyl-D-erythritol 2,4-cyclodiphosphate synthase